MGNTLKMLIIGDSIGYGMGDKEDKGIGIRYKNLIESNSVKKVNINNLSVPGYESSDLVSVIINKENTPMISKADLIVISVGGNDINRIEARDNLSLEKSYIKTLENYKKNLKFIITKIRENNQDAELAMIGLYNPKGKNKSLETKLLLKWNYETRLMVSSDSNMVYIPTYENFENNLSNYLAEDIFHPSEMGYDAIAKKLYDLLN